MNTAAEVLKIVPSAPAVAIARPATSVSAETLRRLGRTLAHRADLIGILTLMGSSLAYGVYALLHLAH